MIEFLREVEYEDVVYNFGFKVMFLAIYYEIDEMELLYSFFESFCVYFNWYKDILVNC